LFAALLADGTNVGLSRMADATRGLSYHHLVNQAQWHINEDNSASGCAVIVEAHHFGAAGVPKGFPGSVALEGENVQLG
jgi:hypothetical protein